MKKIAMFNIQQVDNYGAVLLSYALQQVIEGLGYETQIIKYKPKAETPVKLSKEEKKAWMESRKRTQKRHDLFEKFREEYLNISKVYHKVMDVEELQKFDIYVVGSDVIWKPGRLLSQEADAYFLNFTEGRQCKRIAYAASIGSDDTELLKSLQPQYQKVIKKFDAISVREKSLVPYIGSIFPKEVKHCVDPTLLLHADDYDVLLRDCEPVQEKYIYVYLLGIENDTSYNLVNQLGKELGLKVVCSCPEPEKIHVDKCDVYNDGPLDFLKRIRNAEFVITNSYHGTIFSLHWKKSFIVTSRIGLDHRVKDFLAELELSNHFVGSADCTLSTIKGMEEISEQTEQKLNVWRENSIKYLKEALQ